MNNNTFDVSSLVFKTGNQKKFTKMKPFHTKINLMNITGEIFISIIDLINFLNKLPNVFIYSICKTNIEECNKIDVVCSECSHLCTFQVFLYISQNYANIYFSAICNHINIVTRQKGPKSSIFEFNFIDSFDKYNQFHPLCYIGKLIFNYPRTNQIIKEYLQLRQFNIIENNITILDDFIKFQKGIFRIRYYADNNTNIKELKNLIYFNGKPVQTLCWIAEWAFDSFSFSRKYLQLDASFYALQPYVYCVPLLIINNASLPLGIIIGPSEHQNLFSEFFDLINKSTILPFDCLGILSDEGKSIKSFVNTTKWKQYFCYRHLIEKIGSNSYLGIITKRLLYQPTLKQFQEELPQSISDVNYLIRNKLVEQKSLNKFMNIFNLKIVDNLIETKYDIDHMNGLWHRQKLGISTCSNHIERLHRTMNEKISPNQSINQRILIVINELRKHYDNFSENSCKQAKYLFNKFKENAIKKHYSNCLTCPYNCEWSEIYSNRFGIKNFPCKHIVLSKEIEFDNITIPKMAIYKFQKPTIQIDLQYQNWEFKDNDKKRNKYCMLTMKDSVKLRFDQEEKSFIFQTVSEIYHLVNMKIPKNDIIYDLTMNWAIMTYSIDQSYKINLEFRSYFRLEMMKKYLKQKSNLQK